MKNFGLSLVAFLVLTSCASAQGLIPMLLLSAQQKKFEQIEANRYIEAREFRARDLQLREQEVQIQKQYLELQMMKQGLQSGDNNYTHLMGMNSQASAESHGVGNKTTDNIDSSSRPGTPKNKRSRRGRRRSTTP